MQARGDYPCVVDHELVAGPQQVRKIAHDTILERRAGPQHEQARRIARPRGAQCDPFGRQIEVEEVSAH
jgi:hypothetical protein